MATGRLGGLILTDVSNALYAKYHDTSKLYIYILKIFEAYKYSRGCESFILAVVSTAHTIFLMLAKKMFLWVFMVNQIGCVDYKDIQEAQHISEKYYTNKLIY